MITLRGGGVESGELLGKSSPLCKRMDAHMHISWPFDVVVQRCNDWSYGCCLVIQVREGDREQGAVEETNTHRAPEQMSMT